MPALANFGGIMKNETYEKYIGELEQKNAVLDDEIKRLHAKLKEAENKALIEKSQVLKRVVLFLNSTYGRLGEIQGSLLNELNRLNVSSQKATTERMEEAFKIVNQLLPGNPEDDLYEER